MGTIEGEVWLVDKKGNKTSLGLSNPTFISFADEAEDQEEQTFKFPLNYSKTISFDLSEDPETTQGVEFFRELARLAEEARFQDAIDQAYEKNCGLLVVIFDYHTEYYFLPGKPNELEVEYMEGY